MDTKTLESVAQAMVVKGKGILAMDESSSTCKKRFDNIGVECNEENRRQYRQMLVTAPGLGDFISGAILYDETLRQKADDGKPFVKILKKAGVIPGIKVDLGPKTLALHPDEKITEGLDGLRERLMEYKDLGAGFAKWRAVITIGDKIPSDACIHANAHALARYAALCQEAGIVPIVEPEVLMDGDHTIDRCYEATARTLHAVFVELMIMGVHLPGIVLKPNMVISGTKCPTQADVRTVAQQTVKCLKEHVPPEVPGIAFLSGGQSDEVATAHLDAMNKLGNLPWQLTFSYGRALQQPALSLWAKDLKNNVGLAQKALLKRAKLNGLATKGEYEAGMEQKN